VSNPLLSTKAALVLVVDDQEANVRLMGSVLTGAGFDVMPALSADQAMQRLDASLPDLVLLDLRMPGKDGLWVLGQIKRDQRCADIPVIFVTAAHEREFVIRALEEGAVDYITKPFVAEELVARVRAHAESKLLRDRLRKAISEREEIASLVAHDLKNPLFNISLNASMLAEGSGKSEQVLKIAASIGSSAQRAMAFVQHYLENRADTELGRDHAAVACAPVELIEAVLEDMSASLAAREQVVEKDYRLQDRILADASAFQVIMRNLLSNAGKYAPESSRISISIRRGKPGFLQVAVLDQGPGISESEQSKLFQRFVRLSSRAGGGESSTGLGLAAAMQEARRMGGELWYEDASGGGAAFILELPLAPDAKD
jgi:signal transduction histidine kinase